MMTNKKQYNSVNKYKRNHSIFVVPLIAGPLCLLWMCTHTHTHTHTHRQIDRERERER
jgi:hypothetical protein